MMPRAALAVTNLRLRRFVISKHAALEISMKQFIFLCVFSFLLDYVPFLQSVEKEKQNKKTRLLCLLIVEQQLF